jgi:hypothetical protein
LPIQVDISTYVGGFFQKPQARNWYNFVGNMVMSALLPRFTGSYLMLKGLYQQKELLLQQLQSQ